VFVAHRAIRNRGTIGGSLALAYPGAELPLLVTALGGELCLVSGRGERRVPAEEFITGALETALAEDEYIRSVDIPFPPAGTGIGFVEASRRHGDFAIAAASAALAQDSFGRVTFARLGLTGGTGAPIRLHQLEAALMQDRGAADRTEELVRHAVSGIEVFSDHHYPEGYRRHVLNAVVGRALAEALQRSEARHA
jgi:CO/xanthine dehydrogenase FAD-binding subunit